MKIAIASSGLGHITRGIEAWAHDLAHALRARGTDVILCKGGGEVEADFERIIPCWHRESPRTQKFFSRLPKRGLWRIGISSVYDLEAITFAWNLLKVLRRENIDVLHVQDPTVALIVQRANQLKLVGTRAILGHGTNEPLSFLNKIKYLQHLAPYYRDEAAKAGASRTTWTAIPNFIDTDTFRPGQNNAMRQELGIPADAVVVLSVAAIKRGHKRIDHLIEEVAGLTKTNPDLPIYLVVAGGEETETPELLEIGRRTLGDRFKPLVQFPRHRIADLYRAADIFVLCSLREMMPIALLEATATGLPCIVHEHPSVQWIVGAGGSAIDMAARGALSDVINKLARDPNLRQQTGTAARRHCVLNFSRDRVLSQILEYYRYVLTPRSSATFDRVAAPSVDSAISVAE
jgi:glycosyltransferase involved in cell wall biosynthesis